MDIRRIEDRFIYALLVVLISLFVTLSIAGTKDIFLYKFLLVSAMLVCVAGLLTSLTYRIGKVLKDAKRRP